LVLGSFALIRGSSKRGAIMAERWFFIRRRLGHPVTSVVARAKRRDSCHSLATFGGGHLPVPEIGLPVRKTLGVGRD
jgi:hypothetical protein